MISRKIKMLSDCKGSPDGILVRTYYKSKEYDLPESLTNVFVNQLKVADYIDAEEPKTLKTTWLRNGGS